MKVSIRSSQYENDMADWLIGKSEKALSETVTLCETLSDSKMNLSEEALSELEKRIFIIIRNLTKTLAFACGAEWEAEDAKTITEKGSLGLEIAKKKYGILAETSEDKRIFEIEEFVKQLKPLVFEPKQVIRDTLREKFGKAGFDEGIINELIDMMLEVSKGSIKWNDFVAKATLLFDEIA